jgi:hypothetical protein
VLKEIELVRGFEAQQSFHGHFERVVRLPHIVPPAVVFAIETEPAPPGVEVTLYVVLAGVMEQDGSIAELVLIGGLIVDYFGVFSNLEKALNFDESIREDSLIDWDALRATVPGEVTRCMALFEGITIADTRECLLAALRRLRDAETAKNFEHNFKSLERLWEAVSPDPCLYPHRYQYNWLCGIYVAHRRRQRGSKDTYGELSAKTRQLIQENTTFVDIADSLPVFKIDKDYVTKLDELPSPADKAAALEVWWMARSLCGTHPGLGRLSPAVWRTGFGVRRGRRSKSNWR